MLGEKKLLKVTKTNLEKQHFRGDIKVTQKVVKAKPFEIYISEGDSTILGTCCNCLNLNTQSKWLDL